MSTCVSKTYVSTYSFVELFDGIDSIESLELFLNKLKSIVLDFKKYNNIRLLFSNDFIDLKVNGAINLDDIIENLSSGDEQAYFYYLSEIESIFGDCQSYVESTICEQHILNQKHTDFPYYHPFTIGDDWINLVGREHVKTSGCALNLNSMWIQLDLESASDFINKATLVYEKLIFHPDITDTISDLSEGDYTRYTNCFCHALNTLNQSYYAISNDANQNNQDLLVISSISTGLGPRTLSCTGQGSNKVKRIFSGKNINCEYHLKMNFADTGARLSKTQYNRIYFGLKSQEDEEGKLRKYIYLAHIGKHL